MNRFELIGYITDHLTLSYTEEKRIPFVRFQIGVKDRKVVDFITVIAWRGVATNIIKYCEKGHQIGLAGKIKTGKYEGKDGKMEYFQNQKIEEVTFIGAKKITKLVSLPNANNDETDINIGPTEDGIQY